MATLRSEFITCGYIVGFQCPEQEEGAREAHETSQALATSARCRRTGGPGDMDSKPAPPRAR